MALGKQTEQQQEFWVPIDVLAKTPGHPFYTKLNELLKTNRFDAFVEGLCAEYYKEGGRPGIPPGVYFRMLLIGYFQGIDSERGIAWQCADSFSLRAFLDIPFHKRTPDHSTLSIIRSRFTTQTHQQVFTWIVELLAQHDLVNGKTVGVDTTLLEANAAMRSIVRRDTGASYDEFLTKLAQASGIETPTKDDLIALDKTRKNKGDNGDWVNPHDPDAKIAKMKDGSTHLAHKAEHAVDLETGAILGVTIQAANLGDTQTLAQTIAETAENLEAVSQNNETKDKLDPNWLSEVVNDKGYHSNDTLLNMQEHEIRTYTSEPDRGPRNWEGKEEERDAVYGNRRRIKGKRGKELLKKRGELVERSFAHCYETGGMRRTHLRGHDNILKRVLIHVGGHNLSLILRKLIGYGSPRELYNAGKSRIFSIFGVGTRSGARQWISSRIERCALTLKNQSVSLNMAA
jgi:transposase